MGPLDALQIINNLGRTLEALTADGTPPPFFDVDGNSALGPVDALLVIGALPSTSGNANAAASNVITAPSTDGAGLGLQRVIATETPFSAAFTNDSAALARLNAPTSDEEPSRSAVQLIDLIFAEPSPAV